MEEEVEKEEEEEGNGVLTKNIRDNGKKWAVKID